jgi:hypothetical protein
MKKKDKSIRSLGFTERSLNILVRLGAVGAAPSGAAPSKADTEFLTKLSRVWKDPEWIRESLRQVRSRARREKIFRELELTKPERYVFNRYLNAGERLPLEKVAAELARFYKLPDKSANGSVRKMRSRAYMAKHRQKTAMED